MKKLLTLFFAASVLTACSDDKDDYKYEIDWPQSDFIEFGTTTAYNVDQSGYKNVTAEAPAGWKVSVTSGRVTVTAPAENDSTAETSGTVKVTSTESDGPFTYSMNVNTGIVVGFENVPQNILAVDVYGSNFYSEYGEGQYTEYTDEKSGLCFSINYDYGAYNFWNGGTGFSTLNKNLTDGSFQNQCTVNYVDPETGNGGKDGSKVFGVGYAAYDMYHDEWGAERTVISFRENEEYTVDHMWVMNNVQTAYAAEYGNEFTESVLSEENGYLFLRATGYGKDGSVKSYADFYLVDFRTADAPGIINEWSKFNLESLGNITKLEFSFGGSDVGENGLNTPKYFCFDDIAIRK